MRTIIVESKNDKAFLQALCKHIIQTEQSNDIQISEIEPNEYRQLNGLNEKALSKVIYEALDEREDSPKQQIGILLDWDYESKEDRLNLVNKAINTAIQKWLPYKKATILPMSVTLVDVNTPVSVVADIDGEPHTIEFVTYFTHVDNKGELDTLLKAIIPSEAAVFANSLECWKKCFEDKGKELDKKKFDKFWLAVYIRFDTCPKDDSRDAENKCNGESLSYVFENKPHIFNWDSSLLDEIKTFLRLFI